MKKWPLTYKKSEENAQGFQRLERVLEPTDEIAGFQVRPGIYSQKGAYAVRNGVCFTISSHGATSCTLLLFRPQEQEPYAKIQIPESYRIGDCYSILVYGLDYREFEYAYQFDGPNDPSRGLLFDKDKIILDPYSRAVTGQQKWGERPEGGKEFEYRSRVLRYEFDWGDVGQLLTPMEDLIFYEAHVRGYTKDESSRVTAKGTYEGLREKIPYLKDLGVNAIELMPIFEFDEMENARVVDGEQLYNYWGYNTVGFFAPNTGYSSKEEHNYEIKGFKNIIT